MLGLMSAFCLLELAEQLYVFDFLLKIPHPITILCRMQDVTMYASWQKKRHGTKSALGHPVPGAWNALVSGVCVFVLYKYSHLTQRYSRCYL